MFLIRGLLASCTELITIHPVFFFRWRQDVSYQAEEKVYGV